MREKENGDAEEQWPKTCLKAPLLQAQRCFTKAFRAAASRVDARPNLKSLRSPVLLQMHLVQQCLRISSWWLCFGSPRALVSHRAM